MVNLGYWDNYRQVFCADAATFATQQNQNCAFNGKKVWGRSSLLTVLTLGTVNIIAGFSTTIWSVLIPLHLYKFNGSMLFSMLLCVTGHQRFSKKLLIIPLLIAIGAPTVIVSTEDSS